MNGKIIKILTVLHASLVLLDLQLILGVVHVGEGHLEGPRLGAGLAGPVHVEGAHAEQVSGTRAQILAHLVAEAVAVLGDGAPGELADAPALDRVAGEGAAAVVGRRAPGDARPVIARRLAA